MREEIKLPRPMPLVLVKDKIMNEVFLDGGTKDGLYTIQIQNSGSSVPHYVFICENASINKWHSRLGQVNEKLTKQICKQFGLSDNKFSYCNSCAISKCHKLPSISSDYGITKPLELVFTDI